MEKTNPLVSVIIPTFNRKQLVKRTINSVLSQVYQNIEIILVNDGGEDVQEVVDEFNSPRIKYIQNKQNMGLAGTRNAGMAEAQGDAFVFLDDDDIFNNWAISFRLWAMSELQNSLKKPVEIVYSRALQDIWEKQGDTYVSVHKQLYWDSPFDRDLILIQNIAPCCCPLFSRKAWDDSGNYKFDEKLDTSEDFDFWIALSRKTDFYELKLIDCECSYRKDSTQMTGSRNFGKAYPTIYRRWRETAVNKKWVKEGQNNVLKNMGYNPKDFYL